MPRRIVTSVLQTAAHNTELDGYWDKVVKYIPADVVGAWLVASSIIKAANPRPGQVTLWVVFGVAVLICGMWNYKQVSRTGKQGAKLQTVISVGAFCIWVYALGGPFPAWVGFYKPLVGSLLLIAYSLLTALVSPDAVGSPKKRTQAAG